jgi:hypothetical protein
MAAAAFADDELIFDRNSLGLRGLRSRVARTQHGGNECQQQRGALQLWVESHPDVPFFLTDIISKATGSAVRNVDERSGSANIAGPLETRQEPKSCGHY